MLVERVPTVAAAFGSDPRPVGPSQPGPALQTAVPQLPLDPLVTSDQVGPLHTYLEALPDPPSYSSVRALLRVLEAKGRLRHVQDGPRYVYLPTVPREKARRSALKGLVRTFFEGSTAQAVAALLGAPDANLTEEDLDRLSRLINQARKEGR